MDLTQLDHMLALVECPRCQATDALHLTSDGAKRCGFPLLLTLSCSSCGVNFSQQYTSPRVATDANTMRPFAINDIMVAFFNQAGLGHTAMKLLGTLLGTKVRHLKTFQAKEERLINVITDATDDILKGSASAVRTAHGVADDAQLDVTVSFDGSWHKRGHTSLYGFGAVVEVLTGLILDYTITSKYCYTCSLKAAQCNGRDNPQFRVWYLDHEDDCCEDYHVSSNPMKVECTKRLWSRSVELQNIRYTGMLGDGDSKAFQALVELDPYPGVALVHEECVNHAHKRMDTALMQLAKDKKLGGKGHGRLTQGKINKLQQYYRAAITNNAGDADGMRSAVWATLLHCVSTDEDPHHTRCPEGATSWCFYKRALAADEEPAPHDDSIRHPLAHNVAQEMLPVYTRMPDPNLLKRLAKGKTQNPNECLHSVIWSRCPKTVFVGRHKLQGAAASAIARYNAGASMLTDMMRHMAIEVNEVTLAYAAERDRQRIYRVEQSATEQNKHRRLALQQDRKEERAAHAAEEGATYVPGGFWILIWSNKLLWNVSPCPCFCSFHFQSLQHGTRALIQYKDVILPV